MSVKTPCVRGPVLGCTCSKGFPTRIVCDELHQSANQTCIDWPVVSMNLVACGMLPAKHEVEVLLLPVSAADTHPYWLNHSHFCIPRQPGN
jgi:hypothetical protein